MIGPFAARKRTAVAFRIVDISLSIQTCFQIHIPQSPLPPSAILVQSFPVCLHSPCDGLLLALRYVEAPLLNHTRENLGVKCG